MKEVTIETLDQIKDIAKDLITHWTMRLRDVCYGDIRIEASQARAAAAAAAAAALNGNPIGANSDWEISFGVRVIAGDKSRASGYFGLHLGVKDVKNFSERLKNGIIIAHQRALNNTKNKLAAKRKFGSLGDSLYKTTLAPVEIHQDSYRVPFEQSSREVKIQKVINEAVSISKDLSKMRGIVANQIVIETILIRKIFLSSEGAEIDYTFPMTQCIPFVVTKPAGEERSVYYDCLGDFAGWEVIEGKNVYKKDARRFARDLARESIQLAQAPILPSSEKEVTVIVDPHFSALLVHEIVGHPVELDRVLKWETGYAGRSRFLKSFSKHQIQKEVASPLVTIKSDPNLLGYGFFPYDDEGVKAKAITHIDKGILTHDFLNSRETTAIMQEMGISVKPNGAVRARDPVYVPLVRMTNTFFAPGNQGPEDIIKEVDEGYYFKGWHIPSISESRENFRISSRQVWKIEKGKLTKPYRWGSISSDSERFLKSVDAVGNDFKLYPIFNCGKGQPMQTLWVGNGGPTIRSRAKVIGGYMKGGSTV